MSARQNYEMTEDDLVKLLHATEPVPMIALQCGTTRSLQERVNAAWEELGNRMSFDHMSVQPIGPGNRFFSAIPKEFTE